MTNIIWLFGPDVDDLQSEVSLSDRSYFGESRLINSREITSSIGHCLSNVCTVSTLKVVLLH
ncbi:hypothetical protein PSDVSF_11890 [Pseudodesulfovibrio sediminis]|uniref:Uncharacterized protein n=1 Tax=Pseudodesulfovibrio sediminis TaxID=2810563 RepID=A0ABM7P503_9BACT|nr:hypothetical protein PSDVSF_11890 [Pseudodesulfovibrio sediminis]